MPAIPNSPSPVAARVSNKLLAPSIQISSVVDSVVNAIASYLLTSLPDDKFESTGRARLRALVEAFIQKNAPISLVLPAFPFKSPSKKKVLGSLPDLAEELVLRRLEDLCRSIGDIYDPSARIYIVSDGIVYGELLQVSDVTVAAYNEELRQIVTRFGLTHITFVRVADLLNPDEPLNETPLTPDEYIASAPSTRSKFLATKLENHDVKHLITHNVGALRTYRGYLKFLKVDLDDSPLLNGPDGKRLSRAARDKVFSHVGKQMMLNGARFSWLVQNKFANAVRLSIHPHDNSVKFALKVFPKTELQCTPWHNSVVELQDGSIHIAHQHIFAQNPSYELIYRHGRPYFFRERDIDMDWSSSVAHLPTTEPAVTFERMHPYGLKVISNVGETLSLKDVPMDKIRRLTFKHSLVVLSGFAPTSKSVFTDKAKEMGTICPWGFGEVLEIKDNPDVDMNNVLTREAMPMHFDGTFKTTINASGQVVADPPTFQVFQCINAPPNQPSSNAGGRTLFANTHMILQFGLSRSDAAKLRHTNWTVYTPMNDIFGGEPPVQPLVVKHDGSGHEVIRWHESWPQSITTCKPTIVSVELEDKQEAERAGEELTRLMYDRRFVVEHTWTTGEYVFADNIELLHTRTAFLPCTRELWRIHVK